MLRSVSRAGGDSGSDPPAHSSCSSFRRLHLLLPVFECKVPAGFCHMYAFVIYLLGLTPCALNLLPHQAYRSKIKSNVFFRFFLHVMLPTRPRFFAHWPWTVYGKGYHPKRHEHTSASIPVVCKIEITEVGESIAWARGPNQFCTGRDMSSSKLGMAVGDKHVHGRHAQISHFILAQELTLNASSRRKIFVGFRFCKDFAAASVLRRRFQKNDKTFTATKGYEGGCRTHPFANCSAVSISIFFHVCGGSPTARSTVNAQVCMPNSLLQQQIPTKRNVSRDEGLSSYCPRVAKTPFCRLG